MSYFKNKELPSCSDCDYARLQIPAFDRYSDPYCQRGHGKCEVDKLCGDFKPITAICGRCDFIRFVDKDIGFICVNHGIGVHFAGKTCDEYVVRYGEIKVIEND